MTSFSRRQFLRQASAMTGAIATRCNLPASILYAARGDPASQLLAADWEHLKMPLAGPWGAWSSQPLAQWTPVSVPHCFNSYDGCDGCDPETPAFRGKGWYRRHLAIANPYPNGRTLLHFEGGRKGLDAERGILRLSIVPGATADGTHQRNSWPVRWGAPGDLRTVKVYSNCVSAELFVNGTSAGRKKRDAASFPAAGLSWDVAFSNGEIDLRVVTVATDGTKVIDERSFLYQPEPWSAPALQVIDRKQGQATVEARLLDEHGAVCLDAANQVHCSADGSATLIDNQGTLDGSRIVQMYNGRALVSLLHDEGVAATVAVAAKNIPTQVCAP